MLHILFVFLIIFMSLTLIFIAPAEIARAVFILFSAALTFLATVISSSAIINIRRMGEFLVRRLYRHKWLLWFARSENGLITVVGGLGIVLIPAMLFSELIWLYQNPERHSGHFIYCGWSSWLRWVQEISGVVYFGAAILFMVVRDVLRVALNLAENVGVKSNQVIALWLFGYGIFFMLMNYFLDAELLNSLQQPDSGIDVCSV